MIKKKALLPLLLSLCHAPLLFAQVQQSASNFTALQNQLNNKNFESAWLTAKTLEDEYLGDPAFDFLYGIAALENNNAEYAVFAFERVTANKPNWLDAHFLLAKSNYKIANYQAAISTSQKLVNNASISNKLKQSALQLIDLSQTQLNKQSFYLSQKISLTLGHDLNINSGTVEDDIFLPSIGQSIPLTEQSKEISDSYGALSYQALGSKTFSQVSKLLFSGKGTAHNFKEESDYDRIIGDFSIKYQHTFDFGQLAFGVKLTPLWLNSDFYRTKNALTTSFEKQLTKQWLLTTGVEVGQTKNKVSSLLDTKNVSGSLYAHYFTGNVKHSIGLNYTDEKSEDSSQNYISNKLTMLSYSNLWLINNNLLASSMIAYQQKDYQGLQQFFLEKRSDDMWLASLNIRYTHSKTWSYSINFNAQNKDSNVPLFSYERSDISLTANMNF